ncbi:hypothetical protein [Giesbergeria anulus]|uniref:Transposase C of IS166 homeodomain-containing protein n=1 Tax=Giesbergeria anulus TaxID=180197 RepID=A0A1H9NNM5_9BURK|nr:hypothetical protein [Giesbergeria anulus]SER37502.1 hypothetical protein SAMN02982919_02283 [Giesbergeria anulus]
MTVRLHTPAHLELLDAPQLRELVVTMSQQMGQMQQLIERLTHEMALLKRLKFALQSERHHRSGEEQRELEESIDADLQGKCPANPNLDRVRIQGLVANSLGCQWWGNRLAISLCLVVGRRVMTSRKYA